MIIAHIVLAKFSSYAHAQVAHELSVLVGMVGRCTIHTTATSNQAVDNGQYVIVNLTLAYIAMGELATFLPYQYSHDSKLTIDYCTV